MADTARRRTLLTLRALVAVLLGLLVGSAAARAEPLDIRIDPYLAALSTGDIGKVSGRVYDERRRPQEPDRPVTPTVVMLVPRSDTVLQRLEALRQGARASATAYRAAAPGMRRVRDDYETALWHAGAPHLASVVATDSDGSFQIANVPAGAWVLIGWYAHHQEATAPKRSKKEESLYTAGRRLIGFDAVRVWVREVTVARGSSESFDLTDRNVWFSGVEEDTMLDAGR
jgi:hypothetical protein